MRTSKICNHCNRFQCWHIGNLEFSMISALSENKGKILGYAIYEFQTGYNGYKLFQGYSA